MYIDLIKRAFNRRAVRYNQSAEILRLLADRMLERLDLIKITPTTILELGCATAYCARQLKQRYTDATIYAADISLAMLQQAQQNPSLKPSHYINADAHALPFADHSIDLIMANMLLHWCHDIGLVIAEMRRVLKPNGLVLFNLLGPDSLQELRQAWHTVDKHAHSLDFFDMHDIGDALVQAKFLDPVMDMEMLTLNYSSIENLLKELRAVSSNVHAQRCLGLSGKHKLQQFQQVYRQDKQTQCYPLTLEIINAHAFAPAVTSTHSVDSQGEVAVPISDITIKK